MALIVLDGAGDPQDLKTTLDSGDHVPHHRVDASALPTGAATSALQTSTETVLRAGPPEDCDPETVGSSSTAEVEIVDAPGHYIFQALGGDGLFIRFGATGMSVATSANGFCLLHGQSIERYIDGATVTHYRAIRYGSTDSEMRVHRTGD